MKNLFVLLLLILLVSSCDEDEGDKTLYVYSLVLKNNYSPQSKAILKGAEDAAIKYSKSLGVEVFIDKKYPETEDSAGLEKLMVELVNTASLGLIKGISLSCINTAKLNNIINQGAVNGVRIMTFESDAPNSLRYAYFGPNHYETGKKLVQIIADEINAKGRIAIITGKENTNCYNDRLNGIVEELKKFPNIELIENGIRYTNETSASALSEINDIYINTTNLDGIIIAYSEVFSLNNAIPWEPGKIKIATIDGFPNQLGYLEQGYFNSIIGINYYNYGYNTIEALVKLTIENEEPENDKNYFDYHLINLSNLEEWSNFWTNWLN